MLYFSLAALRLMLHCCFTTTLLALLQAEWVRNDSSYSSPALLLLYCACFTTAALLLLILLQAECVHVLPAQQLYCCVTSSCVGVLLYMCPHTATYDLTQLHVSLYHDMRPLPSACVLILAVYLKKSGYPPQAGWPLKASARLSGRRMPRPVAPEVPRPLAPRRAAS